MEATNLRTIAKREQLGDGSCCTGKGLIQAGTREAGPRYHINASFVVGTTLKSSDSALKPKIKKNKINLIECPNSSFRCFVFPVF